MSDSNRSRYTAIGLAALGFLASLLVITAFTYQMGWSVGSKDTETQRHQTEYADRTDSRIATCDGDAVAERECVEKAIRDNHEQQRAEADLNAQRQMADWAFWVLVVAGASFIVTSAGTFFLAWQVYLTREAVKDTGQATEAVIKANEITEANARLQMRAHIAVSNVTISNLKPGEQPVFTFELENVGSSIARDVQVLAQVFYTRPNQSIRFGGSFKNKSDIPPSGKRPNRYEWEHVVTSSQIVDMRFKRTALTYAGVVVYRDIYGKRHITTFKRRTNVTIVKENGKGELLLCRKGNRSN